MLYLEPWNLHQHWTFLTFTESKIVKLYGFIFGNCVVNSSTANMKLFWPLFHVKFSYNFNQNINKNIFLKLVVKTNIKGIDCFWHF